MCINYVVFFEARRTDFQILGKHTVGISDPVYVTFAGLNDRDGTYVNPCPSLCVSDLEPDERYEVRVACATRKGYPTGLDESDWPWHPKITNNYSNVGRKLFVLFVMNFNFN